MNEYPSVKIQDEPKNLADLERMDAGLAKCLNDVIGALRMDIVPAEIQMAIVQAMSPATRRELVAQIAGLDASVLMTFKQQLQLVDVVLRRLVNEDGTPSVNIDKMGMSVKDALNMSLKVTQVMTRDLPKIYTIERVQRLEKALTTVMGSHMTKTQQNEVLAELERLTAEEAA